MLSTAMFRKGRFSVLDMEARSRSFADHRWSRPEQLLYW